MSTWTPKVFAIFSEQGRHFSFHATSLTEAVSKAKGWCLYHGFCFAEGYTVKQVSYTHREGIFDLHDEWVAGR